MNINTLQDFFMWSTVINGGLLIFSSLLLLLAGDFVFKLHGRWFPMTREHFNVAIYCFLGFFKIVVIVFNLVPYIVLLIMT